MTTHNVSENTLMNVEQALKDGKKRTSKQIAKSIKRDPTTVHRALQVLSEKGRVVSIQKGRARVFAIINAKTDPVLLEGLELMLRIQAEVRNLLLESGPLARPDVVQAMNYPRATTYAAIAEMRRAGDVLLDEGILSLPTPKAPVQELLPPIALVPAPEPVEGTDTGDLPPPPVELLSGLVVSLTQKAIEDALRPIVEAHPEILETLQKRVH
jgi:hypothetical protein